MNSCSVFTLWEACKRDFEFLWRHRMLSGYVKLFTIYQLSMVTLLLCRGKKKRKQECLASRVDITTQKAVKIKCEWLHHQLFIKLIYVESPIHGSFQIAEGFLQWFPLLF